MYVALLLSGELKGYFKKKKKWFEVNDYSTEGFTYIKAGDIKLKL